MRYLASYTAKITQKTVPAGGVAPGRFWGVMGLRETVEASTTWQASIHTRPEIQEALHEIEKVRHAAQISGRMKRKVLDIEGAVVTLWLWDVDDRDLQAQLTSLVENLREAIT